MSPKNPRPIDQRPNPDATKIFLTSTEFSRFPAEIDPAGVLNSRDGGGLRRVFDATFNGLWERGYDVHAIIPEYYNLFLRGSGMPEGEFDEALTLAATHSNIHLVDDGLFTGAEKVYNDGSYGLSRMDTRRAIHLSKGIVKTAREMNRAYPGTWKIYQLNDWASALAAPGIRSWSRRWNEHGDLIPSNTKVEMKYHNGFTERRPLVKLNEHGFNTRRYHKMLWYLERQASDDHVRDMYELTVDFLATGMLASDFLTGVSPYYVEETINGILESMGDVVMKRSVADAARGKHAAGYLFAVTNAPEPDANPSVNEFLEKRYGTEDLLEGKAYYKRKRQHETGLPENPRANMSFWGHRLQDPQKGVQLYLDALPKISAMDPNAQFVFDGNGPQHFIDQINGLARAGLPVRWNPFSVKTSVESMAASDFLAMPSLYEPCGIPQLEAPNYGTLPYVRKTGGLSVIRDYGKHPDTFNGFVFEHFDVDGVLYGYKEALEFSQLEESVKEAHLQRIRETNLEEHNVDRFLDAIVALYESQIGEPLIKRY